MLDTTKKGATRRRVALGGLAAGAASLAMPGVLRAQKTRWIGANAAAFLLSFGVGLYVTYFLLRDGEQVGPAIVRALPLERDIAQRLAEKFCMVVRATIKGSGVVALVQGALGAITFWIVGLPAALLWGVLMAIAALLPAIGAGIGWLTAQVAVRRWLRLLP